MGRVFSSKSSIWFRLKMWFLDCVCQLPAYINPKPIMPHPLTKEELEMLKEIQEEDNE